jgi:hypothetical protein
VHRIFVCTQDRLSYQIFEKFVECVVWFVFTQDPYVVRTLPCLIGSPMFLQDDNVGLMEDVSGRKFYTY